MRQKFDPQGYLDWSIGSRAKTVRLYEEKYNRVSKILDETPRFLELVHKDLKPLSRGDKRGRRAEYTSENILRALVGPTAKDGTLTVPQVPLGEYKVTFSSTQDAFLSEQKLTWTGSAETINLQIDSRSQ